jgi:hypothetical protein
VPVIFQSGDVRLFIPGGEKPRFDLGPIEGKQEKAGAEINLPEPPDFGFIGRDSLMLDMETGFRKETIVLLRGMAGMGKSTAAVGFWAGPYSSSTSSSICPWPVPATASAACSGGASRSSLARNGISWSLKKGENWHYRYSSRSPA